MEDRILDLVYSNEFLDVTKLGTLPLEGIAGLNRIFLENLRAGTIPKVKSNSHLVKTFSTIQMILDGICELASRVQQLPGVTK